MLEYLLFAVAAFLAAVVSGAAGFGGALLLLPLLIESVGVVNAIPLLTIIQLVSNLSRVFFGFSLIQWKPVFLFLIGAIPFSILGAVSFVELPKDLVIRTIGGALLFFIALKYLKIISFRPSSFLLIAGGGFVGYLSGLVGSAGPLSAAIFLSLGLPPVAYVASEAVTALAIHGVKIAVYQQFISLDPSLWQLATLMGVAVVAGSWGAKRIIERIPQKQFEKFVTIMLAVIALYMVVHG